jgi:hypothetical protein
MDELTLFNGNMTEIQKEAVETHYEIRKNAEITANALTEFCKGLKKMRDKKLYAELGCDTFEDYAKRFFGLAQRQAYNYIQALENLGEPLLQSNASLGITKLKILSEIPRLECAEFLENNDVSEMSVRELKEAVAKATAAEEQLSFITVENENLRKEIDELKENSEDDSAENEELRNTIQSLREELKAEREKPVATVERELTPEEIKDLTAKAVKEERIKLEKEKADAVASATSELKNQLNKAESKNNEKIAEIERKYKDIISSAEKEKADIVLKLAEAEKNSKVTGNPDVMKFSIIFKSVQENIIELKKIVSSVDEETAKKLREAMTAVAKNLKDGEFA